MLLPANLNQNGFLHSTLPYAHDLRAHRSVTYPVLLRVVVSVLLGLIFVVAQIHQSLDQGQLAYPTTYDDTTYFGEGLTLLHTTWDRGPLSFFAHWWGHPPHSPWSTLVAFSGLALFGVHSWAPSAMNGFAILVLVVAAALYLRRTPPIAATLIVAALLTWPLLGYLVISTRPDMMWGIESALFAAVIARGATRPMTGCEIALGTALLAMALLTKVTTFPVTLATAGSACAVSLALRYRLDRSTWRTHAKALAIVVTLAVVAALPHYAISVREVVNYILVNSVGAYAKVWELPLSARQQALYHLTGPGGQAMLGVWLWLTLATAFAFAWLLYRNRDRVMAWTSVCYLAPLLLAFIAVTVPNHKSPYIGAIFPAMLGVGWLVMAAYANRPKPDLPRSPAPALAVSVLALIGLAGFSWPSATQYGPVTPERFADIRNRHSDIEAILNRLESRGVVMGRIFVGGSSTWLNAPTLQYYAQTRRLDDLYFDDALFSPDADGAVAMMGAHDGAMIFTSDIDGLYAFLPGNGRKLLARLQEAAETDKDLEMIVALPSRDGSGEVRLYLRTPALPPLAGAKGFGAIEGPYPQWSLPRVRWGLAPGSHFNIPGHPAQLVLEAQSPHAGQVLSIAVDGVEQVRHSFEATNEPETIVVPLPRTPRPYLEIQLGYAKSTPASEVDTRNVAVLFRRIQWK